MNVHAPDVLLYSIWDVRPFSHHQNPFAQTLIIPLYSWHFPFLSTKPQLESSRNADCKNLLRGHPRYRLKMRNSYSHVNEVIQCSMSLWHFLLICDAFLHFMTFLNRSTTIWQKFQQAPVGLSKMQSRKWRELPDHNQPKSSPAPAARRTKPRPLSHVKGAGLKPKSPK